MREHWRGKEYQHGGLLLLGESTYSWMDEDGEEAHPSPQHSIEMVKGAVAGDMGPFMGKLTRALARCEHPTQEAIESAWAKVAFTNYVPRTVGQGARLRPTVEHWNEAQTAFVELLNSLQPGNIIVLGKEMWSKMPDAPVYLTDDVQGYRISDNEVAVCWAVHHPSAGLSWRRLAQVIAFAEQREMIFPN